MFITERQAAFAADLEFADLPTEVVDDATRLLLDTAGIAIGAGPRAASSDAFFEGVRALDSGSGGTVLATGESMAPEYAALLNGAMAHSLDYDDTHRASSLHPGAPVLPAALAAAERVDASGEELLTGLVVGYEVTVETADGTYTRRSDFARGEPENPMAWEEVVEKYESLVEPVLGERRARIFRERIADIEAVSVADLLEPVTADRAVTADD